MPLSHNEACARRRAMNGVPYEDNPYGLPYTNDGELCCDHNYDLATEICAGGYYSEAHKPSYWAAYTTLYSAGAAEHQKQNIAKVGSHAQRP